MGVRIPRIMAERLHMGEGTRVEIVECNQELVIRRKRYSLDELLEGIPSDNTHEETDWGGPRGGEEW